MGTSPDQTSAVPDGFAHKSGGGRGVKGGRRRKKARRRDRPPYAPERRLARFDNMTGLLRVLHRLPINPVTEMFFLAAPLEADDGRRCRIVVCAMSGESARGMLARDAPGRGISGL